MTMAIFLILSSTLPLLMAASRYKRNLFVLATYYFVVFLVLFVVGFSFLKS